MRGVAVAILLLGAWAAPGCSEKPRATPERKSHNVLLVTLDTTRADRLSCYGHGRETSPNIGALAASGVRFDRAIAQAALTPPSHASILTGLNPPNHGVRLVYAAGGYRLPSSIPTLATVLRDAGWATSAFLSSFTVSEFFGFDRGFEQFDSGLQAPADSVLREERDGGWDFDLRANQRRSDQTTDRAIAWMRSAKKPFLLWVHYWDPHDSLLLPPLPVLTQFVRPGSPDTPETRRNVYDAEVAFVDRQFGRLMARLREIGQYDNTIIVLVADHGEGLGDHGHWFHRILYQEQIRVPLIMRLPGGPTGRVVQELVRTVDIYPTVLEVLGVPLPGRVDGRSLMPLIAGRADEARVAYADALILYDLNAKQLLKRRPQDDLLHVAMDRTWKLIYRPNRPEKSELYNLETDPREQKNLYDEEPDEAARLVQELTAFDGFVDEPFGQGTDPEVLRRMRALGYLGDDENDGRAGGGTPPSDPRKP